MKIVILAQNCRVAGGLAGGRNFVNALRIAASEHQYLIFAPSGVGYEQIQLPPGGKFHFVQMDRFWDRLRFVLFTLPKLIKQFNPDRILGLGSFGMLNPPAPQAIRIQNSYLVYPRQHYPGISLKSHIYVKLMRFYLKKCLPYTQCVLCQTPVVKQRFCSVYRYDPEQVKILPNALSAFIQNPSDGKIEVPHAFKERQPGDFYSLVLSRYYAHKNPEIIMQSLMATDREKIHNLKFITTVTTDGEPNAKKFLNRISKYNLQNNIINVGLLPQEQLAAYYRNVDLVIVPTFLESFSVTYLEAMHFGVPILTTDLDFARYICGDAAAYYDPWQPESFMETFLTLKSDSNLRKKLVEAGRRQLNKFSHSWIDMAKMAINELTLLVSCK
jgi:glycosyltransferase involved in cell wall biosynthesis